MVVRNATSRRGFLKGSGALIVSISLAGALPPSAAAATYSQAPPPVAPSTVLDPAQLDSYIKVGGDGTVTAYTSKVELGQGNQTALTQIVAEELNLPLAAVTVLMGDTANTVVEVGTDSSATIFSTGSNLRVAAAEARQALVNLAAGQWNVSPDGLVAKDGSVSKSDGSASLTYAQIIGDNQFHITLQAQTTPTGMLIPFAPSLSGTATPKDPSQYNLVGTSVPRIDIPPKVTGQFTYMQDVKVPGMLHGRVVRPAGVHSTLVGIGSFNPPVPGAQVVTQGDFVGVVAASEWDAINAQIALQVSWSDWSGLPDMSDVDSVIRATPPAEVRPVSDTGDFAGAMANAASTLSATYSTPFQMHGSIGPSCAIADVQGDHATIWSGTQDPHGMTDKVGKILGIPSDNVRVMNVEASGCYGLNGADDVTTDAALMSQLAGKPVRVQYMRQDEHRWEPKGPAMLHDFQGGVDGEGNVVAYGHTAWTPPHFDSTSLTGSLAGVPIGFALPGNLPHWATDLLYSFPNQSITENEQGEFANAIRTSNIRGPAWFPYVFAKEAFADELAAAAGRDPIEFRMAYLSDQRLKDALQAVAQVANWETRPSPAPGASVNGVKTGRGVAIVNYLGTRVAEVAEVQVDTAKGNIQVTRFWVAHDCGLIINPKAVQAQIESNVIQGTSRTLKEEVIFDNSNVTSVDWRGYPILTYPEVPQVSYTLINRPDQPATGVGEPATTPVAAAISNAVFDATGVRLRDLPFTPDSVLAAFGASTGS
ncbi:MAG: xanthine dehydrogenase family protein molybdopterin-binding subunit [Chloroflexi bacterium]|nr:xanthine dehydrogenase family protein molybdopterin-binding subunit [Chloroflexota bacterium]